MQEKCLYTTQWQYRPAILFTVGENLSIYLSIAETKESEEHDHGDFPTKAYVLYYS